MSAQYSSHNYKITLSLVLLHPERGCRRLRDSRQSDHDNFAVPERSENVWISLGEADGLYGQLEGEGGDQVDGVEIPHTQVAVLVSVQKVVVAGQQTWVSHDKWKSILNTRRGDEHQNRGVSGYFPRRKEPEYMYSRQESLLFWWPLKRWDPLPDFQKQKQWGSRA